MRLSRTAFYALRALAHMAARPDQRAFASHVLAAEEGLPERFLLKVLRPLAVQGILFSVKGPKGGYAFNRQPKDISVLDVLEAIEGPLRAELPDGNLHPPPQFRALAEDVTDLARRRLARTSIADLARDLGEERKG